MSLNHHQENPESRACACLSDGGTPLTQVKLGQSVIISCLHAEENICQRLREMGFCESAVVEKVADNGTLICKVCNTKVALSKKLAENIIVNVHSHEIHQYAAK